MLEKLEEGGGAGVCQMSYDALERGEGVSWKRQNTVRKGLGVQNHEKNRRMIFEEPLTWRRHFRAE